MKIIISDSSVISGIFRSKEKLTNSSTVHGSYHSSVNLNTNSNAFPQGLWGPGDLPHMDPCFCHITLLQQSSLYPLEHPFPITFTQLLPTIFMCAATFAKVLSDDKLLLLLFSEKGNLLYTIFWSLGFYVNSSHWKVFSRVKIFNLHLER